MFGFCVVWFRCFCLFLLSCYYLFARGGYYLLFFLFVFFLFFFATASVKRNCTFLYRLVGLVVRRPPRERKVPGSNPACDGIFFRGRVIPVT